MTTPKISRAIEYDRAALEQREAAIRASPALFAIATDREIRRMRPLILKDMALKPRHSTSIRFVWSHDPKADARARGWWFANMVPPGSKGGVYPRTGNTEKQTKVIGSAKKTNGDVSIQIGGKGVEYVLTRDRQIPSHKLSGHPTIEAVAEKWSPIVSERLGAAWLVVSDPVGAVKGR